jgi:hypothetical protein
MDDRDRPDDLPAPERARVRRRDRERTAKERELLRTGQAKAFKQILDAQAKRAAGSGERRSSKKGGSRSADDQPDPHPPTR